jgi:hypothetical protein
LLSPTKPILSRVAALSGDPPRRLCETFINPFNTENNQLIDKLLLHRNLAATVLVDDLDQTAHSRCATMRPSRKATSLDL